MTQHDTNNTVDAPLPAVDRTPDEQVVLFVSGDGSDHMDDDEARLQRDVRRHPDSTRAFITADRDLFTSLAEMR